MLELYARTMLELYVSNYLRTILELYMYMLELYVRSSIYITSISCDFKL